MKLLKFQAAWCGPCKALSMTLKDVEHPLVEQMEEVDVDKNTQLAQQYGIRSVPTMIIVNEEGLELRRSNGAVSKDKIVEFLA